MDLRTNHGSGAGTARLWKPCGGEPSPLQFLEGLHGFLPRMVPMNRMGDRNAAFRLQRVEVPMVLQPEGRVPESRFMGRAGEMRPRPSKG